MDSIRETMDRIHGLFEKHGRKLMLGGPAVPLSTLARTEAVMRRYTPEEKAAALAMLHEGKRPTAVAAALGIPDSTVTKWSNHAGLRWQQTSGRMCHPMRERGKELIRAGWRTCHISAELGVTETTVSNWRIAVNREDAAAKTKRPEVLA